MLDSIVFFNFNASNWSHLGAKDTLRGIRCELRGTLEVAAVEEHVKLGHDERLGSREITPLRQTQRELYVGELPRDERHDGGLVEVDEKHL